MTTPNSPGPENYGQPDPSAYQPTSGAYQPPEGAPDPSAGYATGGQGAGYPPPDPSGGYQQPGSYPPPDPSGGYQPPVYPGGAPAEGAEPPKKNNTPKIIGIVLAVLIVAGGIAFYFVNKKSDPDNAGVGDCINYASESDVKVVSCTDGSAQYKVEQRVEGTSSESACDSVADSDVSLYTTGSGKQYTLCVSLVLAVGDCVSNDGDKVACTDSAADEKVTKVILDSTDDSGCPSDSDVSRVYKTAKRVVCMGPVG